MKPIAAQAGRHGPRSEFPQRVAQMGSRVLRSHQPAPLQRRNKAVGDLGRVAPAVVAERALDQEAIAADLLHDSAHSLRDSIWRPDQFDRRAGAAVGHQLAERLAAAVLLEFVERALLAVGGQFAGKRLVQLVLREIDIGERYALSLTQLRSSIGLALELVMAITNSPRRSNSPSYR